MDRMFLHKGVLILSVCLMTAFSGCLGQAPVNVWSECRNGSAYVYIGANENVRDVKCVALDREFFNDTVVVIGDLSKNDEEVCRFSLVSDKSQPLRFEVWYNDRVQKEVCDWQNYQAYAD